MWLYFFWVFFQVKWNNRPVRMSASVPISTPNSLNHPTSFQIALKRCKRFSFNMPAIATANSESQICSVVLFSTFCYKFGLSVLKYFKLKKKTKKKQQQQQNVGFCGKIYYRNRWIWAWLRNLEVDAKKRVPNTIIIQEQACSTVGKCSAFCAGGPQFDSQWLQRLFLLFSDLCSCSFKYP